MESQLGAPKFSNMNAQFALIFLQALGDEFVKADMALISLNSPSEFYKNRANFRQMKFCHRIV